MKETEKRSYKIRVSNACYIRGHCALISVNASLQFLPERKNCKDADQTNHQRRAVRNGDRNSGRRWRNVCDETAKALQIQTYLTPCLYVTILHAREFGGFRTIKMDLFRESSQKRVPEKAKKIKNDSVSAVCFGGNAAFLGGNRNSTPFFRSRNPTLPYRSRVPVDF